MKEIEYWIWFARIQAISYKIKRKLLEIYQTPEKIWNLSETQFDTIYPISEKTKQQILNKTYRQDLKKYSDYMQQHEIEMITYQDTEYPKQLKNIYDAPIVLFIKGNKQILNHPMLGIIGCRNCSSYGEKIANQFAYQLAKYEIGTISGMAKGIDGYAHWGCLQAKGKTIAVLGSGLDRIYPKENTKLYEAILANHGAIISEYIIGTPPNKQNFPARNRIVSGISNGILVVEAREKSGTLITVDFALEQGKEVYVIPRKY